MSEWQKCPVCDGRGLVPQSFYPTIGVDQWQSTPIAPETCRSCKGKGLLLAPGEDGHDSSCRCVQCEPESI